jgi:hypothetical protein
MKRQEPGKVVEVVVRKGQGEERLLMFRVPSGIPRSEALRHGYALDGDRAIKSVPWEAPGGTFTERLLAAQRDLAAWLSGYGYEVEWR